MLLSISKVERHYTVLEKCLSLPTSWRDLWCLSPWQPAQPGPPCGEKVPQSQQTLPFGHAIPGSPQSHSPGAPGSAWPTGSHAPGALAAAQSPWRSDSSGGVCSLWGFGFRKIRPKITVTDVCQLVNSYSKTVCQSN